MYKTNFSGTSQSISMLQHELHLWIYYMSKFLNTSEFIIMIRYFVTYQVPWFARGSVSFALIRAGIRRKIQNLWQPRYNTKCHRKKRNRKLQEFLFDDFIYSHHALLPGDSRISCPSRDMLSSNEMQQNMNFDASIRNSVFELVHNKEIYSFIEIY